MVTRNVINLNMAYRDQYYYFHIPNTPAHYVRKAIQNLKYDGSPKFETLLAFEKLASKKAIEFLRKSGRIRVHGSTINLLCDALEVSLKEFEGHIEKVAGKNGHGGVYNPSFIDGEELETTLAGILGVVVSDCHVRRKGGTYYYESNLKRMDSFKTLLGRFGEIRWGDTPKMRNGTHELWIPSVIEKIIRLVGIPAGDRTILNYSLPKWSKDWSMSSNCEYMKQMLAQEGWVSKSGRVTWSRSHALWCSGKKKDDYAFNNLLSDRAVRFLKESREMKIPRKKRGFEKIREKNITIGRLERMKNASDEEKSEVAEELLDVVSKHRNRLLDDEVDIIRSLGVELSIRPLRVSYHKNSDRVTVAWAADIHGQDSKIRCALAIPPYHPTKLRRSRNYLSSQNQEYVMRIHRQLLNEGIL